MISFLASFISSLRFLLLELVLIFYFGYMEWETSLLLLILLAFSIQILLLKIGFDLSRARLVRTGIFLLLLISAVLYVKTLRMDHPDWDVQHFYKDIQALRHGESPYSGALSCGMNQNFVPVFALCDMLGDSLGGFRKNMARVNVGSMISSFVLVVGALIVFFRKRRKPGEPRLELSLAGAFLFVVFYVFFTRNMILGNISSWVSPFVLLLMFAHYYRRWVLAGFFLGIIITLKPYVLTVAFGYCIHFLIKRDKRGFIVPLTAFFFLVGTALTLQLIPGGLDLNTYREFFFAVAPVRTRGMMMNVSNISPPAVFMGFIRNLGMDMKPTIMIRASLVLAIAALGAGAYLSKRSFEKMLPLDILVYYLMLSVAIYPIVWLHYFSWLIGPAMYILIKLYQEKQNQRFIPLFILNCFILSIDSLAWIGALALPFIFFVSILNSQKGVLPGFAASIATESARPSPLE